MVDSTRYLQPTATTTTGTSTTTSYKLQDYLQSTICKQQATAKLQATTTTAYKLQVDSGPATTGW